MLMVRHLLVILYLRVCLQLDHLTIKQVNKWRADLISFVFCILTPIKLHVFCHRGGCNGKSTWRNRCTDRDRDEPNRWGKHTCSVTHFLKAEGAVWCVMAPERVLLHIFWLPGRYSKGIFAPKRQLMHMFLLQRRFLNSQFDFQRITLAQIFAPKRTFNGMFRLLIEYYKGTFAPKKAFLLLLLPNRSLQGFLLPTANWGMSFGFQDDALVHIYVPKKALLNLFWLRCEKFSMFWLPIGYQGTSFGSQLCIKCMNRLQRYH